jgi:tRNA-modifying protein YgfZ
MSVPTSVLLVDRGVLRVTGEDAHSFLQGLVSNNVLRVAPDRAIWAAFLTAQGRYLHDFFLSQLDGGLILEGESARLPDLKRRLSMYKLRSRVTLEEPDHTFGVWALIGDGAATAIGLQRAEEPGAALPVNGGVVFVDPRTAAGGLRAVLPRDKGEAILAGYGFTSGDLADYHRLRITHGLPDGSRDMQVEKSLLLECGFDELHGIDWEKGCYLGQELTARTRYRGLVKRRLVPVTVDGALPPPGTPILLAGKEIGEVRSGVDGLALAFFRLDGLAAVADAGGSVVVGEARLIPHKPSWANF